MRTRTALCISCSEEEARIAHFLAEQQRRTLAAFLLGALERRLRIDEQFFAPTPRTPASTRIQSEGPRTTMLLRCSIQESERIRAAARKRRVTIGEYVRGTIATSWNAYQALQSGTH